MRELTRMQSDAANPVLLGRVAAAVINYCAQTLSDAQQVEQAELKAARDIILSGNAQAYAAAILRVLCATNDAPQQMTDSEIVQAVQQWMPRLL